jgi:DNA replication protein DnaC
MTQTAGERLKTMEPQKVAEEILGTQPAEEIIGEPWNPVTKTEPCKKCQTPFQYVVHPDYPNFRAHYCKPCEALLVIESKEREKRELEEERKLAWIDFCPAAFQQTEIAKLPHPEKAADVLSYEYSETGLTLHGPTRKGKSRIAWLLIRKLFLQGYKIQVFNSMSGLDFAATYSRSTDAAADFAHKLARVGVLFLDDPFKVKLTESVEAMLFAVINERLEMMLPIIATMNDTPATLADRMSEDRGMPMIQRLKECTRAIKF